MDGLVAILAGAAAIGGAVAVLRSFGPAFRVARLLSSAPSVSVAEANAIARSGRRRFVRISGRIDSESEFEDHEHRPLVFRRTRLQSRPGDRWVDFDVVREVAPFEINEGLDTIAVRDQDLDVGLVVVPRETAGIVGDLGDRAPDELPDADPARVIVEQVSSVEHAIVAGVPVLDDDGRPVMTASLGRPLILTTLELPEAMRILAAGNARRPRLAAGLFVAGAVLVLLGIVLFILPGSVLGASPDPTAVGGSDTRSPGEGPGLVGAPLAALGGVLGIAALALVATLAYVRLTDRGRPPTR